MKEIQEEILTALLTTGKLIDNYRRQEEDEDLAEILGKFQESIALTGLVLTLGWLVEE